MSCLASCLPVSAPETYAQPRWNTMQQSSAQSLLKQEEQNRILAHKCLAVVVMLLETNSQDISKHLFGAHALIHRGRLWAEATSGGRFQGETSICLECNYLTVLTSANVRHELAWKINYNTGEHSWQGGQCYAHCGAHQRQSWRSHCECVSWQRQAASSLAATQLKASREKSCLMLLCRTADNPTAWAIRTCKITNKWKFSLVYK